MGSGTHQPELLALLNSDFNDHFPHVLPGADGEDSFMERMKETLTQYELQDDPLKQDSSSATPVSPTEKFLLSDFSPPALVDLPLHAILRPDRFVLP